MPVRRLLVVLLATAVVLPSACLRQKKESALLAELNKPKLPAPQPPLPVAGADTPSPGGGVQPPKFDPKTSNIPALPNMPGTASQPLPPPPASVPDSPPGQPITWIPPTHRDTDSIDFGGLPHGYTFPVRAPSDYPNPIVVPKLAVPSLNTATDAELEARLVSASDDERKGILEKLRERRQERIKEREKEKEKDKPMLPPATEPRPPMPVPVPPKADQPKVDPKVTPAQGKEPARNDLKAVRELIDAAAKKNDATSSFEAKLVKREVVKGKEQPAEEAIYRFRKDPLSVHIRVTGDVGTGREVMWVKGQNDNKMTVVTGKGDTILGTGIKTTVDPDDTRAAAKSRYRIYEAGMQRPIGALTKFVEQAEAGKRPADSIRYLGQVERKEYKTKPYLVEVTLTAEDDKFLPKGGKRLYHFDADPKSPSAGLPVLVISLDHENKEVEYYCFTDFKLVGELTDADFDPAKVGKKK